MSSIRMLLILQHFVITIITVFLLNLCFFYIKFYLNTEYFIATIDVPDLPGIVWLKFNPCGDKTYEAVEIRTIGRRKTGHD